MTQPAYEPLWTIEQAQAHFEEVVERAIRGEKQFIVDERGDKYVMLAETEYRALIAGAVRE